MVPTLLSHDRNTAIIVFKNSWLAKQHTYTLPSSDIPDFSAILFKPSLNLIPIVPGSVSSPSQNDTHPKCRVRTNVTDQISPKINIFTHKNADKLPPIKGGFL